jgi:hypothetical protein
MLPTLGYIKLLRTILQDDIMDDPNEFILLMQAALKAWRGPGISKLGLAPGEAMLTRPQKMSDKEYRTAKARLAKRGLLTFRTARQNTISCLAKGETLADPQIIWDKPKGELRGGPQLAEKPRPACNCETGQSSRGEPKGEVEASRANLLGKQGEFKGEPRDESRLSEKPHPASDCEENQGSRGEPRGELKGEAIPQIGRTFLNKKENKDSSSRGGCLELLWSEVTPTGKAERPPLPHFQRKCGEWLSKHAVETVRALIFYANANARSQNGYLGYIDATIKSATGIQDAQDYWRAALDRSRKTAKHSEPSQSSEERKRNQALFPLRSRLLRAKICGDQETIERLEAELKST